MDEKKTIVQISQERVDNGSFLREAKYIIEKAKARQIRAVGLGAVVFFSTADGDAWMLDPDDGLAMCLAREGKEQPYTISETKRNISVSWSGTYQIDGDLFIAVVEDTEYAISGYPIESGQSHLISKVSAEGQTSYTQAV